MSTIVKKCKEVKYLSLFLLTCMAFTFAAEFRYYVNQNIYAAFNLGNLGAFGANLSVSVLIAVFAALGWAAGIFTAWLTRKKQIGAVTLYWLSGMFAIVALFFTPYNLQLLMPSTIMQNIAMIACIAHIVFILVDMWLFAWAICVGSQALCLQGQKGLIIQSAIAVVATILAYLAVSLSWSFSICVAVYGGMLIVINILHAAFPEPDSVCCDDAEAVVPNDKVLWIARAVVTGLMLAVLIGAYYITESHIAIA